MTGWREVPLAELVRFRNGKSIKGVSEGHFPVYGSNGIIGTSERHMYENAIVLGRVGAYCGSVEYCPGSFWATDNTIVVEPKKAALDVVFAYYMLLHADLNRYAGGAAQPLLTQTNLKGVLFSVPPLATQRRIAAILRAYDDLIEVNRRRMAVLEEMARRLFDRLLNETITHSVPLGELLDVLESGSRPKGGVTASGDIPSIGAENVNGLANHDYSKEKRVSLDFFRALRRGIVQHGDVMLYKDGAHIGRTALAWSDYPHKDCAVNEHVFLLRPMGTMPSAYLYFYLSRPDVVERVRKLNTNAAQPGLNQNQVRGVLIEFPPLEDLERFRLEVSPMLDLIFTLAKQHPKLIASRDLLLPRLISGQLSVEAAERELENAA